MSSAELQTQDAALKKLNDRLAELKAKSELAITDDQTYIQSAGTKIDFENYIRAVESHYEPELAPAEEKVKRLKLEMSSLLTPVKGWLKALVGSQRDYAAEVKRKEENARRLEQERIDAEARAKAAAEKKAAEAQAEADRKAREKEIEAQRKAGEIGKREAEKKKKLAEEQAQRDLELAAKQAEQTVKNAPQVQAKPVVPTGVGMPKNQTYYYADVTDVSALFVAYEAACLSKDAERRAFLRRFIMVNEQEVGVFARQTKDNAKATSMLPGVLFTSRG